MTDEPSKIHQPHLHPVRPNHVHTSGGRASEAVTRYTKRYATVTEALPDRFSIRLDFEAAADAHHRAWRQM